MRKSGPTIGFYVHFKNGKEETHQASSFEELKTSLLKNDNQFHEKVKWISWKEKTTLVTYSTDTGELYRSITDGDVNPYGWRMQHR